MPSFGSSVELSVKQINVPSGPTGRRFVEQLDDEFQQILKHKSNSEKLLVFLCVMLQQDPRSKGTANHKRRLNTRLNLWKAQSYDRLVHDTLRTLSNNSFRNSPSPDQPEKQEQHMIQVFNRMMLEGKVRQAMR